MEDMDLFQKNRLTSSLKIMTKTNRLCCLWICCHCITWSVLAVKQTETEGSWPTGQSTGSKKRCPPILCFGNAVVCSYLKGRPLPCAIIALVKEVKKQSLHSTC